MVLKTPFEFTAVVERVRTNQTNIVAARSVSNILRSSLGPKGMDKMLVSPDGDLTITNDGATILEKMQVEHQVGILSTIRNDPLPPSPPS